MAYGKVEDAFWNDQLIRGLSEPTRWFLLYLITNPHRNRLGCYVLDPIYAAADMQWPVTQVEEAIAELVAAKRIEFDAEARVVLVRRFLKHNTMENENVVKGSIRDLRSVPTTPLLFGLLDALEENARPHYTLVLEALRNRLANDYPNGLPNGSGNGLPNGIANKGYTEPSLTEPLPAPTAGYQNPSLIPDRGQEEGLQNGVVNKHEFELVIRSDWHQGTDQVEVTNPKTGKPQLVGMGLEHVRRLRLIEKGVDPEELNGACEVARAKLEIEGPMTMGLFEGNDGWKRLNECMGAWHKRQEEEALT